MSPALFVLVAERLPAEVQSVLVRRRAVRLMHSQSLPLMEAALRVEAAACRLFPGGTDKYLSACNRITFGLLKPECERLRRRILLNEPGVDLDQVVKVASTYSPDFFIL